MECNRDEALRAKEIAERKFTTKDMLGAKKFALKAQTLYPELDGITQMLATLDVHMSAESKINSENDWYSILRVSASADEEVVKKQYRKLALLLHPDKNKSVGAEGAFKLVSEAWSVLSDRSRRSAYDQKRNIKGFSQKPPPPPSQSNNGFYNFTNNVSSGGARVSRSSSKATTAAPARPPKSETFWTVCNGCKMQYEYLRVYLNHNLLCPNCHEPFLAVETGAPPASNSYPSHHHHNSNHRNASHRPDSYNSQNFQWGPFSRTAGAASTMASSAAAVQAASVVHHTYEKVRREREEAQAAARREEALWRKTQSSRGVGPVPPKMGRPLKRRKSVDNGGSNGHVRNGVEQVGATKSFSAVSESEQVNGFSVDPNGIRITRHSSCSARELSQFETRNMLMDKAKADIRKKLNEWSEAAASKLAGKEKEKGKNKMKEEKENDKEMEKENGTTAIHADGLGKNKSDRTKSNMKKVNVKKDTSDETEIGSDGVAAEPTAIDVPDPDFYDFDKDRTEQSFEPNQVWATYDGEDGMPRYYAFIQKVISVNPFKIRISFLNSKSNSEFSPLNWVGSGFAKTCGEFRISRYEISDAINAFSHKVKWEKRPRGVIQIVPCQGDVWALYRNWTPDWNEHTPDEVIYKYDMVEVLEDYTEEQGVSVIPLVKVEGFKTVFHRHLDPKEVKRIPREEMFRFSHRMPSYLLTGEEAHNAPKGCWELDPAATPLELLQVVTEAKEAEVEQAKE
ncbi:hypothetical protein QJS04_geneDACA015435 [Acorus gramineus]|uniref:J domain-containing protein n=1 Tax=Acorus gramineus TaxID=55184 RepID=A0AAV9A717_ACOGR|nr:hypothetical protein QJS04_geneDACA015435 [Acorus gramineus]